MFIAHITRLPGEFIRSSITDNHAFAMASVIAVILLSPDSNTSKIRAIANANISGPAPLIIKLTKSIIA